MTFTRLAPWQAHDETGRRRYITRAERQAFLAVADRLRPDVRALCHVYAYSGCRVSEALELRRDRMDLERCALTIRTLKRRRTVFRTVPVPDTVLAMLLALPVHPGGRFWIMHRATAWRHVSAACAAAGIEGPMACGRGLRHGYCLGAALSKVPPNLITKWAGHSSASTTYAYLDAVGFEEREFAQRMW